MRTLANVKKNHQRLWHTSDKKPQY